MMNRVKRQEKPANANNSPSLIDEVIGNSTDEVSGKGGFSISKGAEKSDLLIAEVTETEFDDANKRIAVKWTDKDGRVFRKRLLCVRGIEVNTGDVAIISQPSNWPEPIVTDILQTKNESKEEAVGVVPTVKDDLLLAEVDGRRVEIRGKDEIVLQCGEAAVILRRNGRVVIRGIQIETRAKGLNRIKGGTVSIN